MSVRHYRNRSVRPSLYDFNERQEKINKSKKILNLTEHSRRALFSDWNYEVELFALGARLRETFDHEALREALRDPTFFLVPEKEKIDLSLKDPDVSNNSRLEANGRLLITEILEEYLTQAFPKVPQEGIVAFRKHLMSDYILAFVALHVGLKDLLVSEDYPPKKESLAKAFCAIIGAHAESGNDRAQTSALVVDLIATQLVGADLHDIWKIKNPMEFLTNIMKEKNLGSPEARLQWISGKNTILASYHVGIYSNKNLIGECTGESVEIAKDMAATDALRRIFDTDLSKRNLYFNSHQSRPASVES